MKIEEACKKKGTLPEFPNMYCLIVYHSENNLLPCWYDAKTDHFAREVTGKEALRTDWQPFPEEKEIRPEKAGELWNRDNVGICFVINNPGCTVDVVWPEGATDTIRPMIHSKNGWTRLYPPVEEDVERIEIEGVAWRKDTGSTLIYPGADTEIEWSDLKDKPRMKMILEIPKT